MMRKLHAPLGPTSRAALVIAFAGIMAISGGSSAAAQDATPANFPESESDFVLENGEGEQIGSATVIESGGTVTITIEVDGLEPGEHAVHIHNPGVCESEDGEVFRSTGGHGDEMHGPIHNELGTPVGTTTDDGQVVPHAGDLGNITVADDGTGTFEHSTDQLDELLGIEHTLDDPNGSALTIHQLHDDLSIPPSDFPSGASGPHIACGVIHPHADATPAASPAA